MRLMTMACLWWGQPARRVSHGDDVIACHRLWGAVQVSCMFSPVKARLWWGSSKTFRPPDGFGCAPCVVSAVASQVVGGGKCDVTRRWNVSVIRSIAERKNLECFVRCSVSVFLPFKVSWRSYRIYANGKKCSESEKQREEWEEVEEE
jgi:hypothetical protein